MSVSYRYVRSRKSWGVFIRVDGKRSSKYFKDEERAKRFAELVEDDQGSKDRWLSGPDMPCDASLLSWFAVHKPTLARSTEATASSLIDVHLVPFFGNRDLRSIDEPDLIEFIDSKMTEGKSAAVCLNALSLLRRVCELHVKAGMLSKNPARGCKSLVARVAKRHAPPKRDVDSWTPAEAQALMALAWEREPFVAPAIEIAFATGMRRGEILALTWADIDFARRKVLVTKSLVRGHIGPPKSGRSRIVPMASSLATSLKKLRKAQKKSAPWSIESSVCPAPNGGVYEEANFSRAWRRLRKNRPEGVRPLAFHCARHTFATLALEAGRSVKWLADVLGHADPTITLRTYAHAFPADDDALDFVPLEARHADGIQKHADSKTHATRGRK